MKYKEILLDDINQDELKNLYGVDNQNINILSDLFNREIIARGNCILVDFDIYNDLYEIINQLINMIKHNHQIDENTVKHTYNNLKNHIDNSFQNLIAITTYSGKPIKYKTYKQYILSEIINKNDLIFSIGSAGTGKTFLAVLLAVKALKNGEVKKIILTRPAVEAGESLGFLPGDLKEKINPYLMPLYDSLEDILGSEQVEKLIEKEIIEVIPLAYMRGRTLNDAFIILDEAQNTTDGQMLMFLTRLGYNSKMIVNGDLTQIDLNINKNKSGLVVAVDKLKKIKGIDFIEFDNNDIVRNPIVSKIIDRFKK